MKKIYLAGPDVFRKDAKEHGEVARQALNNTNNLENLSNKK